MPEENQNKKAAWIDKLEALDQYPGNEEQLNQSSWEMLYHRLEKKTARRQARWYWVAAAIVVTLTVTTWIATHKKQSVPSPVIVKKEQGPLPIHAPATPAITIKEVTIFSVQEAPAHETKNRKKIPAMVIPAHPADDVLVQVPPHQNDIPVLKIQIITPDTMSLTSVAPLKKKLRVVHINEVERESLRQPTAAAAPLNLTASNGEPAAARHHGLIGSQNASDDIVKIKLSLSN